MTKPGRIPCIVPDCQRTRRHDPDLVDVDGVSVDLASEWICATHWRRVPEPARRVHSRAKRRLRRFPSFERFAAGQRIWQRVKRLAARPAGIENFLSEMGME